MTEGDKTGDRSPLIAIAGNPNVGKTSLFISGTLSTNLFDVGASLEDDSTLHVNSWNTNLHDDVLDEYFM